MDDASLIAVSIAAHFAMIVDPGPDFALVARFASTRNGAASFGATTGIAIGSLSLSLGGLVLAQPLLNLGQSDLVHTVLSIVAGAFLFWQAFLVFGSSTSTPRLSHRAGPFIQGFVSHTSNIEVLIFYAALFARLNSSSVGDAQQVFAALTMSLTTFAWFHTITRVAISSNLISSITSSLIFRLVLALWLSGSAVWLISSGLRR
jgi:threonine/homoserine/homoserine lactone efflux protein